MMEIERVYEHHRTHGTRFLVERLWPRGIRKESLEHNNAVVLRDYVTEKLDQPANAVPGHGVRAHRR